MKSRKILLISHDCSRTGAPILLLNLAEVLKADGYSIDFLLKKGGPLVNEFKKKGRVFSVKERRRRLSKYLKHFGVRTTLTFSKVPLNSYEFIISNTITNGDILQSIRAKYGRPIYSYIHELENVTDECSTKENVEQVIACSTHFFVPSLAVQAHLIDNLYVPVEKISFLKYYIPPFDNINFNELRPNQNSIFKIGSAGTIGWRKNPDIIIHVARIIKQKYPSANFQFLWLGATIDSLETKRLYYDVKKMGLENCITFLPSSSNVMDFYKSLDLFLLSSREDPYPLVVLEAASAKLPIICFRNSGGAPEFIEHSECGDVVEYGDMEALADSIMSYYNNRKKALQVGENGFKALCSTHHDPIYILNQFKKGLERANPQKL